MRISYTLSKHITNNINTTKKLTNKELLVYNYCLEFFFDQLIFSLSVLIIGFLLHKLVLSVCFVLFFIPLKMCAGGFHMNSRFLCSFTSYFIFLISIYLPHYLIYFSLYKLTLFFMFASFGIIFFTPVEHPAKPFSAFQRSRLKKIIIILILITYILFIIFYIIAEKILLVSLFLYVIIIFINQIIGLIINHTTRKRRLNHVS